MNMATHINLDDPRYRDAAAQILSRHDALQPEANITSAVRHFLVLTCLARNEGSWRRTRPRTPHGEPWT